MNVKNLADVIAGEDTEPFTPEEVAFFIRKAYEQHPKVVTEILQELSSAEYEPYTVAYRVIMSGIRELVKFIPEGSRSLMTNDFLTIVADLQGPGSARVKSDIVKLLNENIATAEQARLKADAVEYAKRLGDILEFRSTDTVRLQCKEDSSFTIITTFQHILRHHPQGLKVTGNILANITVDTAKDMHSKNLENRLYGQILGKILGYVENALDVEFKNRRQKIENGSEIVKFMADAVIALLPAARDVMTKVKNGIILSELELPGVKLRMVKFRADIHRVVNETFRQIVDPAGCLVSGSFGEEEQRNYLDAFTEFEISMVKGREKVLRRSRIEHRRRHAISSSGFRSI